MPKKQAKKTKPKQIKQKQKQRQSVVVNINQSRRTIHKGGTSKPVAPPAPAPTYIPHMIVERPNYNNPQFKQQDATATNTLVPVQPPVPVHAPVHHPPHPLLVPATVPVNPLIPVPAQTPTTAPASASTTASAPKPEQKEPDKRIKDLIPEGGKPKSFMEQLKEAQEQRKQRITDPFTTNKLIEQIEKPKPASFGSSSVLETALSKRRASIQDEDENDGWNEPEESKTNSLVPTPQTPVAEPVNNQPEPVASKPVFYCDVSGEYFSRRDALTRHYKTEKHLNNL